MKEAMSGRKTKAAEKAAGKAHRVFSDDEETDGEGDEDDEDGEGGSGADDDGDEGGVPQPKAKKPKREKTKPDKIPGSGAPPLPPPLHLPL